MRVRTLRNSSYIIVKHQLKMVVLSQEDIDGCRQAFLAFDKDRSGTIDVWELRQVLEAMGQAPTGAFLLSYFKSLIIHII